jgi:hypothetical protein
MTWMLFICAQRTELLDSRSHKRLLEQRSHRRPDYSRIERVYAVSQNDESGCTGGGRRSQKRTEVPGRTQVAQRSPTPAIGELDLIEALNSLAENRCDAGCAFGLGDSSKVFGRYPCERDSGAFQSSNEFPGERVNEKLLAVEQSFH